MQMHQIKRKTKQQKSRYVGRGGKRGKTSGRGTKGQKARAGRKLRPELRDVIKKLPKLRGRGKNINKSIQADLVPLKLAVLEQHYSNGEKVSPSTLVSKGLVSKIQGANPRIKILAGGVITKSLVISGCKVSAPARAALEKAGGSVK